MGTTSGSIQGHGKYGSSLPCDVFHHNAILDICRFSEDSERLRKSMTHTKGTSKRAEDGATSSRGGDGGYKRIGYPLVQNTCNVREYTRRHIQQAGGQHRDVSLTILGNGLNDTPILAGGHSKFRGHSHQKYY